MENPITQAIAKHRQRAQEIIGRSECEKLDDARIKIKQQLTASPESMYEWLADNVSAVEIDALTHMALYLMITEHYHKPIQALPVQCFRFVTEEVGRVIDEAARKAVE